MNYWGWMPNNYRETKEPTGKKASPEYLSFKN